jgi:phosphohistidine phosphatase
MFLILIRHAKSSWEGNLIDHERPLSTRGIQDAQLVFHEISSLLNMEYKILSSTSKRTTQTSKIFCTINDINFENILFKDELYTFNLNEFEKVVSKNFKKNLIIFGHNNAITDFVNKFGDYYIENVPTCGVVVLKFDELGTFSPNKGAIIKTIFPRDLK